MSDYRVHLFKRRTGWKIEETPVGTPCGAEELIAIQLH